MTELLAVLTAIFVVYALYEVFATVSQLDDGLHGAVADGRTAPEPSQPQQPPATASRPATPVTAPTRPAAAAMDKHITLRNPLTDETSPVPSNYRFAKKWIKEAMVTEGLLAKVYKNSELTESLNSAAKEAIEKFKHLEKYHG
jgi:hypothetical protein